MSDRVPAGNKSESGSFVLRKLVPERRSGDMIMASPGCSCCCCCCLHSAGGLVGAMLGSTVSSQGDDEGHLVAARRYARKIYWTVTGILLAIGAISTAAVSFGKSGDAEFAIWMFLIFFPGFQLAVSVVTLIVLAFNNFKNAGSAPYKQLGKITLFSAAGAILGGVLLAAALDNW